MQTCKSIAWLVIIQICGACQPSGGDESSVEKSFGATGLGAAEFSYPRALAVSPVDGCVFVVDKTARIQRFSASGDYQTGWQMPEWKNGKPTGLCVDKDNHVWAADTHYARVLVFDRDGKELFRFGTLGEGPGQFTFPTDVAIDRDGYIYVGEYGGNDRISKFSPRREYILSFADKKSGDAWVERPQGLVFDADDNLWVTDACHHRICRYDRGGRLLSAFPSNASNVQPSASQLNFPYGIASEKSGTMLVTDRGNNRIVRFDRTGLFLNSWGTAGRSEGQLAQPWDVAVRADGAIYVLDSWNNRVQVIHW